MNTLQQMRQNKALRVFIRQTFNGFITLLIAYASEAPAEYALFLPMVYAFLNSITKYVNSNFFGDLWVEK